MRNTKEMHIDWERKIWGNGKREEKRGAKIDNEIGVTVIYRYIVVSVRYYGENYYEGETIWLE